MTKRAVMTCMLASTLMWWTSCMKSESDVTHAPEYNFAPFTGTLWRSKVKVAIAELDGRPHILPPDLFDPTHPSYRSLPNIKMREVLPVGTRVRIARLMRDNGVWGGVRLTATVEDGVYAGQTFYLERGFLVRNNYMYPGDGHPRSWAVNPELLEE